MKIGRLKEKVNKKKADSNRAGLLCCNNGRTYLVTNSRTLYIFGSISTVDTG